MHVQYDFIATFTYKTIKTLHAPDQKKISFHLNIENFSTRLQLKKIKHYAVMNIATTFFVGIY